MFDRIRAHIEKIEEAAKPVVEPVASYVHHRRGRFSALGTVVVLYPWLRRPHHTWKEFEKDFRMYDSFAKTKSKPKPKAKTKK
jgi:hypothetical protein